MTAVEIYHRMTSWLKSNQVKKIMVELQMHPEALLLQLKIVQQQQQLRGAMQASALVLPAT